MAVAELPSAQRIERRSVRCARAAGREALELLARAERDRARAVAQLVDFHAIDGHVIEGYLTPQRHLVHGAGLGEAEANRLHRLVRFCQDHPSVVDQLLTGSITLDHADALRHVSEQVDGREFTDALPDLLAAAVGVELALFTDRIRTWQWRIQPEVTDEEVGTAFDRRSVTLQPGLFGGGSGRFELDPAGFNVVVNALQTRPDRCDTIDGPRSLAQRRADRLVELALLGTETDDGDGRHPPSGGRQISRPTVDVIVDLPTLFGFGFDLDDHRTPAGEVDWASIEASFALTGSTPRRVAQQFFCDASWRTLITAGGSIVLDYTHAKTELNRSQRRAVQRRDRHCQFSGCDRHWSWCDVHHLRSKEDGGWDLFDNLVLLCRRHHTMVHHQGWQLWRDTDGRIHTATP